MVAGTHVVAGTQQSMSLPVGGEAQFVTCGEASGECSEGSLGADSGSLLGPPDSV